MKKFITTNIAWLPRTLYKQDAQDRQILAHVDTLLEARKVGAGDGNLAQQILDGVLQGNEVARTMICGILHKAQCMKSGKKRVHASSLPNVEETRIVELGSALSACTNQESLLNMFGFTAPKLPASSMWRPDLPRFFCPTASELQANADAVLHILQCASTRDFMVCWDDTTFWPQWSLQAFEDGMYYVGGTGQKAKLHSSEARPGLLKKEELAQQCVSYLLKRASTRKQPYDICFLPKRLADVTRDTVMAQTGLVLQAVTDAAKVPPICCAYDNHASHGHMNSFFLGVMPKDCFKDVVFFRECVVDPRSFRLPCYRFASMAYQGKHSIFSHNDAAHSQKCLTRAIRVKTRIVEVGRLKVWPQLMLTRGLPASAWRGTDNQSDSQSSWLLNPQCVDPSQWDSMGLVVWMFQVGLWCGSWLSSHIFKDGRDLLECALEGYYMLLFDLMETGGDGSRYFHAITQGNLLAITGHLVERVVRWPSGIPFRPSACMEDASEHHFGRVKSNIRFGLPTIRTAIVSTQRLHMKQKQCLEKPDPKKLLSWQGLSDSEATEAGRKAFDTVCMYKAITSVGRDAADCAASLQNWWEAIGKQTVTERLWSRENEEELQGEEDHSDAEDVVVDPADPHHSNLEVSQTLCCLELEASAQAEIANMEALDAAAAAGAITEASDATAGSAAAATSTTTQASETTAAQPHEHDPDTVVDETPPMTLHRILQLTGFSRYAALKEDSEHAMLMRVHRLLPEMLRFVVQMRLGEGFLRPGQVQQPKRPLSKWNQLQKDLSTAQRSYGLQGARQGRAASWWGFANLVAAQAQDSAAAWAGTAKSEVILKAPAVFRPSNILDDAMNRHYQVVVLRLHPLGCNQPAIVCRVFRGSLGKKKRSGSKPHEEALPCDQCVGLQLVLPEALGPESPNVYRATCLSPSLTMDPSEDRDDCPRLLMEIADGWFGVRATSAALLLEVPDAAAKQLNPKPSFRRPRCSCKAAKP